MSGSDWKGEVRDLCAFFKALVPGAAGLITGGIVAAIITVYSAFGGNVSRVIIWTLIAVAFLAASFRAWRTKNNRVGELEEKIRPKIKLFCEERPVATRFGDGKRVNYFRLVVTADCLQAISGCTGFLINIKKDQLMEMAHESIQLTFSPGSQSDALSKTIHPDVPAYLDILAITEKNEILICAAGFSVPFSIKDRIFGETGAYILTTVVSGNGISPERRELRFNWTGDFNTASLTASEKGS